MSLAWMGRRVVRYLVACGLLAALVYALAKPEPPRVGYAKAIAGIPVNKTAPPLTGDLRLGGVLTCGPGVLGSARDVQDAVDAGRPDPHGRGSRDPHHHPGRHRPRAALRRDRHQQRRLGLRRRALDHLLPAGADRADAAARHAATCAWAARSTARRGTWNDDGVPAYPTTIQWTRNNEPVNGQTASTYTVTQADMGRYVGCRVSVAGLTTSTANALYPTAPAIRSIPAVTGDLRLGGKLSCSRGVWDDEGITAVRHDQAVAARRRGDPRRDRRRLHRPPRRHRPLDRLPRPRGGPRRLAVEQRLPDEPVAALAAGHRGRPAARPHALLHARHVGRRRPHRRLRRRLRLVPPGHPRRLRPDVHRHRPRRRQAAALHGHGRRQDGGQQPDDLRPAAHEPDRPGDLRRRPPRPQRSAAPAGPGTTPRRRTPSRTSGCATAS